MYCGLNACPVSTISSVQAKVCPVKVWRGDRGREEEELPAECWRLRYRGERARAAGHQGDAAQSGPVSGHASSHYCLRVLHPSGDGESACLSHTCSEPQKALEYCDDVRRRQVTKPAGQVYFIRSSLRRMNACCCEVSSFLKSWWAKHVGLSHRWYDYFFPPNSCLLIS